MLRPVSLLPALVAAVLAGLLLVPLAAPAAAESAPRRAADTGPLEVIIDNLTPSTVPERGEIRVSGTVTNVDEQPWTTINLYSFISDAPMTTSAELAEAATLDPEVAVGERVTDPGPYETIDQLDPGETAQFSFSVPRRRIAAESPNGVGADAAGVYWFGVHALGQAAEPRDDVADGRARTFLPLVPPTSRTVDAALVLPIRRSVQHLSDGSVANLARWTRTLGLEGQLRRMTEFGAAAGDRPITWLVDPAVVDTAVHLTEGNPPRSIAPTLEPEPDEEESESPSPTEEPTDADVQEEEPTEPEDPEVTAAAAAATDWLGRLQTALGSNEILSLPYGDVDVAGAAAHDPAAYRNARKRSGTELAPWGLTTTPVIAPPAGYLPTTALGLAEPDTQVLVSDRVFGDRADNAPTVAHTLGRSMVVSSSASASGGPGPGDQLSPLSVRQRILSEAALRVLTPGRRPLVTVLPQGWAPEASTGFFSGLDTEWLRLTTIDSISQRSGRDVDADRIVYPDTQREAELDALDFSTAQGLVEAGEALQNLLTLNDRVGGEVQDEALTNVSYASRRFPQLSRDSASRSRAAIEQQLESVTVEAPKAVILSSGSGRFSATVNNGLDQPVTVRLDTLTDPSLEVSVPDEAVEVGPGARSTILLNAESSAVGVRNVTLLLTDVDGSPIGSSDTLPIRSNRVSNVIWLILGTGIALLFGTIIVRLFRRIRAAARS
ncbi:MULTISPECIES: DUF6049 family protein [unclassified Nocardioides]|uniref:DUF6049 family protein n=1 Tax=unclassified Nocardioides TaxID=2615069 RepID=UPI003606BE18